MPSPSNDYIKADWERYRALDRLVNHWDRPGWGSGRRSYHWLIAFREAGELESLAAACQAALQDLATLDPIPQSSMHITLARAAFTDEMTEVDAQAIVAAARRRCANFNAFDVRVGPLAGSPGAVRFTVGPHQPIRDLMLIVRAATNDVRGPGVATDSLQAFVPHVSIAYSNATTPAQPVIDRVAVLRALGSVTVRVNSVELVELRREERKYLWREIGAVTLTS